MSLQIEKTSRVYFGSKRIIEPESVRNPHWAPAAYNKRLANGKYIKSSAAGRSIYKRAIGPKIPHRYYRTIYDASKVGPFKGPEIYERPIGPLASSIAPEPATGQTRGDVIRSIIKIVASLYKIKASDLLGPCRRSTTCEARHIAMYAASSLFPAMSTAVLGRLFGNRDHTTILHARKKARNLISSGVVADPLPLLLLQLSKSSLQMCEKLPCQIT